MKILLKSFLFIIAVYQIAFAQIVTTTPANPTQYDSIVVYFDATQTGASELLNYTGTVYAHTGVTVDSLGIIKDWQYVIGTWGSTSQPTLTWISTNYYKLVIGYPRQFYHVTNQNVKIIKLDFVFRSSDGSKQTDPDILYNLYEPGLTLEIQNPQVSVQFGDPQRSPAFVKVGETVPIKVDAVELGTKVSSLNLFVDGTEVTQSNADTLTYNFVYSNFSVGAHTIMVTGTDTTGNVDTTSFMMFSNPQITEEPLPNGIRPGINYTSSTTAVLALFAPYKEYIYVIGDFNDWKVETNYFMKKQQVTPDSVIWWIELNSLSPDTQYAFQYFVDGKIRTGDPYCELVLDPWNDKYISSTTTYPDLKPYPTGKTESIVGVLQTAQAEYPWQVQNFQKPPKENLIVYELLVRDFSTQHDYQFMIDTLSYLKSLGVNAIELMPIMEFTGNDSWGYNPIYLTATDKYYGTADKLKEFIDLCHQNGIAVILDMVLNQTDNLSPLAMLWWDASANRPAANNPYLNAVAKHPYNVFNDMNHESNATKYFVDRVTEFWVTKFKFDGFRFDLSKGFTQNYTTDVGVWSAYDQSRINILERMANQIWNIDSSTYVILEHFADNTEEKVLSNYGMLLWGNLNYNYNEATMGWIPTSNFSSISYLTRGWTKPNLLGYMESHDEERLMYKNLRFGNSSGTYNIKLLGEALNRIKLAAAFFFTVPGPKMLWQFGELGYDISIFYDPGINAVPEPYGTSYAKTYPKPIRWNYLDDARRTNLYKVFKTFIDLKKNYPAFFSPDYFLMDVSSTIKKINLYHSTMDVSIIGNFGVTEISANQNFSRSGKWYDYFNADSIEITDDLNPPITLLPGEFKVYTTVKLPAPEKDILSEVELNNPGVITEFKLEQNYPNPFNPSTIISWQSPVSSHQTLKVFDMLGREIVTLVDEYRAAGKYDIKFDASKLSSGIYIYRIQAGSFVSTKKMIYLK